jgi:hypothetical protein
MAGNEDNPLAWPPLSYPDWAQTCAALHLWTQMIGKYRLARTPWVNHSWQVTLYCNARGFTTSLVPDGPGGVEIQLDLIGHTLVGAATDGRRSAFDLGPMSVAEFHRRFSNLLSELGASPQFHGVPSEVPDPVPFADDHTGRPYDAEAVTRFFRACVSVARVFERFRSSFIGKVSPVHLFWGGFDMAVTRFSGRRAPLHSGGVPGLPDEVAREAYSHEVSSAGFWPGGSGIEFPAFYSYAYPEPPGFPDAHVHPKAAYYDQRLREFVLPYDAVRLAEDPDAALMAFLDGSYGAAADLGGWERTALDCPIGLPGRPRLLSRQSEEFSQPPSSIT